jgi:hypothetical protein
MVIAADMVAFQLTENQWSLHGFGFQPFHEEDFQLTAIWQPRDSGPCPLLGGIADIGFALGTDQSGHSNHSVTAAERYPHT